MKKIVQIFIVLITFSNLTFGQEMQKSNLLNYTPSKLLKNKQMDFKIFNNLYTQTKSVDDLGVIFTDLSRQNYFTSTLETYRGISNNRRINIGLILNIKSNNGNALKATSVFNFSTNTGISRAGISNLAPSLKVAPFNKWSSFSIQTSFYIPIFKDEPNSFYLDKRSYISETKFYFDHTFTGDKFQIFAEADVVYHLGTKADYSNFYINNGERFANNSVAFPVSLFASYFLTKKLTLYVNGQHYTLLAVSNNFSQNFTLSGIGLKYQLTDELNIEISHAQFLRGNSTGLGKTYNLGFRFLN